MMQRLAHLPSSAAFAGAAFRRGAHTNALATKEYNVLFYTYVDGMLEKRGPHRPAHLKHAEDWKAKGKFVNGGAFVDPVDGGMLVFQAPKEDVEEFARNDPYVKNKLVTEWHVRGWNVVA